MNLLYPTERAITITTIDKYYSRSQYWSNKTGSNDNIGNAANEVK